MQGIWQKAGDQHNGHTSRVAYSFGYTPEMIDRLIALGHTPEEIEAFMYEF